MQNIKIREPNRLDDATCHECSAPATVEVVGYHSLCSMCGNAIPLCWTHATDLVMELAKLQAGLLSVREG